MRQQRKVNILLYLISIMVIFPVGFMIIYSFSGDNIISLVPKNITLNNWREVFLRDPGYLIKFWKSIIWIGMGTIGQVLVSIFGGIAFAKYEFPGKREIYFVLLVLMMMPVQVTLVPNYFIFNEMNLLGTWWALVLPIVFLPFGTVFLAQVIRKIPDEILEAARLDGAGTLKLCFNIVVPFTKSGIASLAVLTYIDSWNMVEQPMVFLNNPSQYPLSVFLASISIEKFGTAFVCGILALLPVTLLYLYFKDELQDGLTFLGVK